MHRYVTFVYERSYENLYGNGKKSFKDIDRQIALVEASLLVLTMAVRTFQYSSEELVWLNELYNMYPWWDT